jgi:hypothetical protein
MIRLFAAVAVVAALSISPLHAAEGIFSFMSGNALYEVCMSQNLYCAGYIVGVADMVLTADSRGYGSRVCVPADSTQVQMVDVVKQFLIRHPEQRHYAAAGTVQVALAEAFPCAGR